MSQDYDGEIRQLTSQISELDAGVQTNLMLEEHLQRDADRLQAELGTPEVALNPGRFAKVNGEIEAALLKKAATARALTAVTKARGELVSRRDNVTNAKHRANAREYGLSALAVAQSLDEVTLPELRQTLERLVGFTSQTAVCMAQAGSRDRVFEPRSELALTLAQILRDCGLDVVAGPSITMGRSNSGGYKTITEALAEFSIAIEA